MKSFCAAFRDSANLALRPQRPAVPPQHLTRDASSNVQHFHQRPTHFLRRHQKPLPYSSSYLWNSAPIQKLGSADKTYQFNRRYIHNNNTARRKHGGAGAKTEEDDIARPRGEAFKPVEAATAQAFLRISRNCGRRTNAKPSQTATPSPI